MTTLATNLFIAYIVFMMYSYVPLIFNKKKRKEHIEKQNKINELRDVKKKTIEEQKEFINLKYPKKEPVSFNPFKWETKKVLKFILRVIIFISIFLSLRWVWDSYIIWQISLWQTFLVALILPIVLNFILKKFGIKMDDITIFF